MGKGKIAALMGIAAAMSQEPQDTWEIKAMPQMDMPFVNYGNKSKKIFKKPPKVKKQRKRNKRAKSSRRKNRRK